MRFCSMAHRRFAVRRLDQLDLCIHNLVAILATDSFNIGFVDKTKPQIRAAMPHGYRRGFNQPCQCCKSIARGIGLMLQPFGLAHRVGQIEKPQQSRAIGIDLRIRNIAANQQTPIRTTQRQFLGKGGSTTLCFTDICIQQFPVIVFNTAIAAPNQIGQSHQLPLKAHQPCDTIRCLKLSVAAHDHRNCGCRFQQPAQTRSLLQRTLRLISQRQANPNGNRRSDKPRCHQ